MFEIKAKDNYGRVGILKTNHGTIKTPNLMPVIHPRKQSIDVKKYGADIVITNAYLIYKDEKLKAEAVEKGLQDCLEHGPLAGFPVIGVRAVLYDGSYHPVDSNEISFKIAASLAFKNAVPSIKPTILEPIMEVKVVVKSDYVGAVMGDMSTRRGSVSGIDPLPNGKQQITATVPESEISKYATDLKGMTQGSGHFSRKFVRYDEVPEFLVSKIIAEYKKEN